MAVLDVRHNPSPDLNYFLVVSLSTTAGFYLWSQVIFKWLTPWCARHKEYEWKAIGVAFTHACCTGFAVFYW